MLVIFVLVVKVIVAYESNYFSVDNEEIKDSIRINDDTIWKHVVQRLEKRLDKWRRMEIGTDIIPEIQYKRIRSNNGNFPEHFATKVRKRGIVIVRNVVSKPEVETLLTDLIQYMHENGEFENSQNKTIFDVFWSKPQIKVRQHPHIIEVERALLRLLRFEKGTRSDVDMENPLMYADGLYIRAPESPGIPPGIDGEDRWQNPVYRKVYRHLLEKGDVKNYDPFEIDYRIEAESNFFGAFRGWFSLNGIGPGEGTLKVLPLLRESTAYWLLRPFIRDVPRQLFPGCFPGKSCRLTRQYHSLLMENLIPIPILYPGDTVWWHQDLIHGTEDEQKNDSPNHGAIMLLSVGPDCALNRDYSRKLRHSFAFKTNPPPDFHRSESIVSSSSSSYADFRDLSTLGRRAMGLINYSDEFKDGKDQCLLQESLE